MYLSGYLKRHQAEYDRRLSAIRSDGDWETWLEFFLTGVAETAGGAVETMHRLLALFREDESRVSQGAASLVRLYHALRAHPVANITELARRSETSFPTASAGIDVEAQYTSFGSSGAIVVTAAMSVLPIALDRRQPRPLP